MTLHLATPEDARELLSIYAPYVSNTAVSFEYEPPTEEAFSARIAGTLEKYPYLVAEENGRPMGYAYAGAFKSRAAYGWCVETSIYLRMDSRRRGYGRALYTALERALAEMGITSAYAVITTPRQEDPYLTKDSIHFHTHMGYQLVGTWPGCGYKFGRWYDVSIMEKTITPRLDQQPPVRLFSETAFFRELMGDKKQHG